MIKDPKLFLQWMNLGIDAGWIAPSVCTIHEGIFLRDWEQEEFDDGGDPCIVAFRLLYDGFED